MNKRIRKKIGKSIEESTICSTKRLKTLIKRSRKFLGRNIKKFMQTNYAKVYFSSGIGYVALIEGDNKKSQCQKSIYIIDAINNSINIPRSRWNYAISIIDKNMHSNYRLYIYDKYHDILYDMDIWETGTIMMVVEKSPIIKNFPKNTKFIISDKKVDNNKGLIQLIESLQTIANSNNVI